MRLLIPIASMLLAAMAPAQEAPVRFVRAIPLPGVEGRIDHLSVDASGQKLFVAALGNNSVEVIDIGKGIHLKSLAGFREPQGIRAAGAPLIAVANGQGDGIQVLDSNDYHVVRSVALGDDSDNVRFDAQAKTLYVGYGAGALAAVDPVQGNVTGRVMLAGHPESFQLEGSGSRIFVNVPEAEQIAVVDRRQMKVIATWPVTGARSNYPMALDEEHHRLFVGCRRPAKVLVFDTVSGKPTGSVDTVGDTDDMFFDGKRQRLYVAGGEGFIDVFDARATLTRVARVETAAGARTGLFVPERDMFYLAVPHRGSQRGEIRVYEVRD
jgi:DNA-binding beta-propeller fold protein YncE